MTAGPLRADAGLPMPRSGTDARRRAAPGHSLTHRPAGVQTNSGIYRERSLEGTEGRPPHSEPLEAHKPDTVLS